MHDEDVLRRLLEDRSESLLALPDRLLGALALGDVPYYGDHVLWSIRLISYQGDRQTDPDDRAILPYVALLYRVGLYLPVQESPHLLEIGLEVLVIGYVLEGFLEEFVVGIAHDLAELVIYP